MNGNFVFVSYKGSQRGVSVRDFNLNQLNYFDVNADIAGIAAGPHYNDVYLAAGNHLMHYQTNGNLICDMEFPIASIHYTDVTVSKDHKVLASYTGSQHGVTVRDLQLDQKHSFDIGVRINGIAAGANNDMYLACGHHIYHYKEDGTLLNTMTFPDHGITYTDVVVMYDRVYASYKGSQRGVTVRDLNLNQLSYFSTHCKVDSLAAGPCNDLYLASENHLYRYDVSGNLITEMVFPDSHVIYTGVSLVFKNMT